MPPADGGNGESFSGLMLQLRGRIGLTQRDLAVQVGVHVHSVQGWESGTTYPGVTSLRALIAAGVEAGGFTAGREEDEAAELWSAAMREAPRFRTAFDPTWFAGIVAGCRAPVAAGIVQEVAPAWTFPVDQRTTGASRHYSWGEAPDVAGFLGRATERELLAQWVHDERCRVVALCGLGVWGSRCWRRRSPMILRPPLTVSSGAAC